MNTDECIHIETPVKHSVKHVVMCTPGFPVSFDDPHKPFLLDHAMALAASGTKVTVVCPAHPDAPLSQTITQPPDAPAGPDAPGQTDPGQPTSGQPTSGQRTPVQIKPVQIEVVRVRFAPPSIARRIAQGASYREFSGVAVVWVLPLLLRLIWTAARLARTQARRSDVQVLHGHWWFPAGVAAVVAARLVRGARSAVHVHGSDLALVNGPISRWFARRTFRSAHTTVVVSQRLAHEVADMSGGATAVVAMPLRTGPLGTGALGTGSLQTGPAHADLPSGGNCWEEPPADGPLLAVGRLVPEKGFDVLLDAVAQLQLRGEAPGQTKAAQTKVVIVGEGEQRGRLTDQAARLGVELELVGEVAPADLASYYSQARLVVVPSRREGFGLVIAQGLAAGRTVVASEVGAAADLIAPRTNGLLTAPADVAALADAIAAAEPGWGINGPASVSHLSPTAHASAMHAAYLSRY